MTDNFGDPIPGGFAPSFGDPLPGTTMPEWQNEPAGEATKAKGRKNRKSAKAAAPASLEKQVVRKVGSRKRIAATITGLVVAALVAALFFVPSPKTGDYYVVVVSPMPAMSKFDPTKLVFRQIPEEFADQTALHAPTIAVLSAKLSTMAGARVRTNLTVNQQVRASDVLTSDLKGGAADLGPDEALVAVGATVSNSVAGIIRAGDKVDLYGTGNGITNLVLPDVEIVTVTGSPSQLDSAANTSGKGAGGAKSAAPLGGGYTLRVPNKYVSRVIAINQTGSLVLVLRATDHTVAADSPANPAQAVCAESTAGLCSSVTGGSGQ